MTPPAFFIVSEEGYESRRIASLLGAYRLATKYFNPLAEIPIYLWDALQQGGTPVILDIDAEHIRTKQLVRRILQASKKDDIIGISTDAEKLTPLQGNCALYTLRKPVNEPELLRTVHTYLSKQ